MLQLHRHQIIFYCGSISVLAGAISISCKRAVSKVKLWLPSIVQSRKVIGPPDIAAQASRAAIYENLPLRAQHAEIEHKNIQMRAYPS